jgi:hypothetical protein
MANPKEAPALPNEAAEITRLIEAGNSKTALEAAKQLHKRAGSAASEWLLIEAYIARAKSMFEHRMDAEAEALIAMVRQRFPAAVSRLQIAALAPAGSAAEFDNVIRTLADPGAPAEAKASAERRIRADLTDLGVLANSALLPLDHPLRRGAAAVQNAFSAVTSGPVDDAALGLAEVSRRSPLGPWKPLLRAIAAFHRYEDAACEEHLRAIDPESAPARLIPLIRALLSGGAPDSRKPASVALAARLAGEFDQLRGALRKLDHTLQDGSRKQILDAVRGACALAKNACPEILATLRQQLMAIAALLDIQPDALASAMGGMPKNDARSRLMLARGMESAEATAPLACTLWDDFLETAIREGWFPARGPETATVYLHMADLAAGIGDEARDEEYRSVARTLQQSFGEGVSMEDADLSYLDAGLLFARACEMDPHAEAFQRWAAWAESRKDIGQAEKAAAAWRSALPHDPRPLLYLMRYAEGRNALKKALGYLREAEAIDGLNSEVRRARLRLLIGGAVRHLKQRKPKLALKELAELEALPQAHEGHRPAFVKALQFVAHLEAGDVEAALAAAGETERLLGGKRAAGLAFAGVNSLCGMPSGLDLERTSGSLLEAAPRVYSLFHELGLTLQFPPQIKSEMFKELRRLRGGEAALLEGAGRMALAQKWDDLAFAVSAAGLALGGATEARFLLLRAQALPDFEANRADGCVLAANALARRHHDPVAEAAALEFARESGVPNLRNVPFTDKDLAEVLAYERKQKELPSAPFNPFDFDPFDLPFPRRRKRGKRRRSAAVQDDLPF